MNKKYIIFNFFWCILLVTSLSSCDLNKLKSGELNGEQKSLILLSNNFIKNSFQIRLIDESTLKSTTNDFIVNIISNKKIIDFEGHYTNSFNTKNGIVNFALDPNETVSSSDTLNFVILTKDNSNEYKNKHINKAYTSSGRKVILIPNAKLSSMVSSAYNSTNTEYIKSNSISNKSNSLSSSFLLKTFKVEYSKDSSGATVSKNIPVNIFNLFSSRNSPFGYDEYEFVSSIDYKKFPLKFNDLIFSIQPNSDYIYKTSIEIFTKGTITSFNFDSRYGRSEVSTWPLSSYNSYYDPLNSFYNNGILVKQNSDADVAFVTIETELKSSYKNCKQGINFNFSGLASGAYPNFLYKQTYGAEGKIRTLGIANPNKTDTIYNTGELNIPNNDNYIDFYSSQYDISPVHAKFTSLDCGKALNFNVTPKAGLVKTKFVIKVGCDGTANALTPNMNFELSKDGVSLSESFSTENGISVLYLDPKSSYNMSGMYGSKKFDFNFSLDATIIQKLITESLVSNPELKDIKITFNPSTTERIIYITPIFNTGSCPL